MLFTITYRGKDGTLREEAIEAADRTGCVAECRKRGISPTKIVEGGKGNDKSATARSGRRTTGKVAILSALVIAALVGGVLWWSNVHEETRIPIERPSKPKAEKPNTKSAEPRKPTRTNVTAQVQGDTPLKVITAPTKKDNGEYVDERGIRRTANGLRIRTGEPARKIKLGYEAHRRFKNMCDEHIAGLLEIVPGRMVFGRMEFGKKFVEDFKASLNDKIEILDTDSEYDKQLKRDVIATREELKAAMQRGEDIGKLLTDARNQLQEIGRYREELKKRFYEYRKEGTHTAEELQDFVKAANVMLEEQGAKPIKLSSLLLRNLKEQQGENK